mmetsp:Transcript_26512/g.76286  ORF Transcript_26512/g.76286 Transcript_26512/m.76286 type:complete len:310 (-) Transcript_26512:1018-1947(-)
MGDLLELRQAAELRLLRLLRGLEVALGRLQCLARVLDSLLRGRAAELALLLPGLVHGLLHAPEALRQGLQLQQFEALGRLRAQLELRAAGAQARGDRLDVAAVLELRSLTLRLLQAREHLLERAPHAPALLQLPAQGPEGRQLLLQGREPPARLRQLLALLDAALQRPQVLAPVLELAPGRGHGLLRLELHGPAALQQLRLLARLRGLELGLRLAEPQAAPLGLLDAAADALQQVGPPPPGGLELEGAHASETLRALHAEPVELPQRAIARALGQLLGLDPPQLHLPVRLAERGLRFARGLVHAREHLA